MVKAIKRVDIREIFLGLQDKMQAKLHMARRVLTHPVSKGDASEIEWLEMLSGYLPARYCADKAFVIDCDGRVSEQIDIVIYDRHYSPFILKQSGSTYIPAESVYAVIEVKPCLTKGNVVYAAKKAASVRILKRTAAPIVHAGGKIKSPKKPFHILAGILAVEGKLSSGIKRHLDQLDRNRFLNFGCSLKDQAFWFKTCGAGKYCFEKSVQKEALVFFFLNLLAELQKMGTVPAMDIDKYIRAFKGPR